MYAFRNNQYDGTLRPEKQGNADGSKDYIINIPFKSQQFSDSIDFQRVYPENSGRTCKQNVSQGCWENDHFLEVSGVKI